MAIKKSGGVLVKQFLFWKNSGGILVKKRGRFDMYSYNQAKKKYMCVYGHPTDPIFQPPTLTFFIGNYSTLIFAGDPINFYTEFW